jgi:ribonuclease HI
MSQYYVVHKGRNPGIYSNWNDCKKQIDKYDGAIFKKFSTEAEATQFLELGFGENKKPRGLVRRENDDKKHHDIIMKETSDLIDDGAKVFIYTDGSCIKQVRAGYGIYIPSLNIQVSKPLLNQKITNNRAELTAIIESVSYLDEADLEKKICIFTDSQYSMYLFNGTGERYEKEGYKKEGKDVTNIDLIKKLLLLKRAHNIVLLKVRAHTEKKDIHSKCNEIADKLALSGALQQGAALGTNIFSGDGIDDFTDECYEKKGAKVACNGNGNCNGNCNGNKNNKDVMPVFLKSTIPDASVKMNDLFEFSESSEEDQSKFKNKNIKTNISKNTKLTNWFVKK